MKHVSKVISKTITSTNSQEPKPRLSEDRVKRLFALMQANYGTRWVNQTGTGNALKLSVQVWAEKLAGLEDKQIARGLQSLPEDFPPTPAKFYSLCTKRGAWEFNTAAYKVFPKSRRIEQKADKAKARNEINNIKRILEGASV